MSRTGRVALGSLALATVYFLTARIGLNLATVGRSVTLVWPPSGLALAILLMHGRTLWPGVAAGAFAVNALTPGVPPLVAATMALGNTAGALLGATLLRQAGFEPALRRVSDVLKLVVLAGMLSTLASALIGTFSLQLGGLLPPGRIGSTLRVWWTGDLMGVLIVGPLVLSARDLLATAPRGWRVLEGLALAVVTVGGSVLAFRDAAPEVSHFPPHMLFPVLIWAALRFGPRGAAWINLTVSIVSVWATVRHLGPFARPTMNESLLLLQTFMAMLVVTVLILGAAAAERDDAVQAREDFISIASHELRTPLTPLTLQLDRLRRMLSRNELGVTEVTRLQASLERQTVRLTTLVDILLDVTRLRAGPMRLKREAVDLAALARETIDGLGDSQARNQITLEAEGPVDGRWDRVRVQQAITNLLTNAIKYGDGKPIAVTVGRDRTGKRGLLVVRDQGPGIARRDQARLFRRFQRIRSADGNAAGGLGLGLYITRQIVEAHGGTVKLESRLGAGATFTCSLPLAVET